MSVFIVERYWPDVTTADVAELGRRLRASTSALPDVSYLGSVLLVEDAVVQCRFEAPDADAVRSVNAAANAPFDRILLAYPA
jgi:hypothetical protein